MNKQTNGKKKEWTNKKASKQTHKKDICDLTNVVHECPTFFI